MVPPQLTVSFALARDLAQFVRRKAADVTPCMLEPELWYKSPPEHGPENYECTNILTAAILVTQQIVSTENLQTMNKTFMW